MNDVRLTEHWNVLEVQLNQAAQFPLEPDRFELVERDFKEYQEFVDNNEFQIAMDDLAGIAQEFGCKSGFWRRLTKAAIQMDQKDRAEQYEQAFHEALARNR